MRRGLPMTARPLVTAKEIGLSSVGGQTKGLGRDPAGKIRERRITATFMTADAPTPIYHGLGFRPTGFIVVSLGRANTTGWIAPGKIYNDFPLVADSRVIVLKCDTANTVAEILVR